MLNNNPITMATITANSSLHQIRTSTTSENRNDHPREVFISSSYLISNEEKVVADSGRHVRSSFTSNRGEHLHFQLAEKKVEDGDIGVFEAHKYFNGGMDHESPRVAATTNVAQRPYQYHHKDEEHKALEPRNLNKSHYGTPSVRSESSWNSQSKLLPRAQRNLSRNRNNNKIQRKSFLAGLVGCKCSCADNNSVDISNHNNHNPTYGVVHGKGAQKNLFNTVLDADSSAKTTKPREELSCNKDVCFKKPDLAISAVNSSGLEDQLVNMKLQKKEEEKPRKSLEVFGSPILNNRRSLTFDKRHTTPSWDAAASAAKVEEVDNCSGNYNDTESDASSDLFEIDSLTGKTNHFLNRQSSEVASGCASPTTCYAPSEASIEWSVATASAADFSVLSDGEEQSTLAATVQTKASRETQRQRRHSSTLLGCKSYKAIRVAGDAFITYEKPNDSPLIRRRSDTLAQLTRFKADPKMGNFGAIHGKQHAYAGPPLQRSYSSHVSQPLYI